MEGGLIAPCGMNCSLCLGYQRAKNSCAGCIGPDTNKPRHCTVCRIKLCPELARTESGFCYACAKYPCARLKQLDKRYRTNYGMSMLENLQAIAETGLESFIEREKAKWTCESCGALLCVHRDMCLNCGAANARYPERTAAGAGKGAAGKEHKK